MGVYCGCVAQTRTRTSPHTHTHTHKHAHCANCDSNGHATMGRHVWRISKNQGWVPSAATRETTYEHMNKRVPDELKYDLHCLLVEHGKRCFTCAKGQSRRTWLIAHSPRALLVSAARFCSGLCSVSLLFVWLLICCDNVVPIPRSHTLWLTSVNSTFKPKKKGASQDLPRWGIVLWQQRRG